MSWSMGVDIGSAYSKGVITRDLELVASHTIMSGANYRASARAIRSELMGKVDLSDNDIINTVATGYGADSVYFADQKASDIWGAIRRLCPSGFPRSGLERRERGPAAGIPPRPSDLGAP